jgi:hypothetical protein
LNVASGRTCPEGISVYADADLPYGWVRLSDGTGEIFGEPESLAVALAAITEVSEDWHEVWDALGEVGEEQAPQNTQDWPAEEFETD